MLFSMVVLRRIDCFARSCGDRVRISGGQVSSHPRLLENGELREIECIRAMSSDLVRRLESGRREVLEAYLRELDDDFRCAQSLFCAGARHRLRLWYEKLASRVVTREER